MWPLKIGWEALTGIFGSVGRFLSLAGILAAVAGGIFLYGVQHGKSSVRADQHEAEMAALKRELRIERELAAKFAEEKDNLQHALEQIDAEPSIESAGASCRLDPDFMQQLAKRYGQNWRGSAAVPIPDQRVH